MFRVKLIARLIHLNENLIFYPRLKKFYREQIRNDNPLVIDVGANKGQSIDFFQKNFKNCIIHAFEPNKDLFDYLVKKYHGNRNVFLYNEGISDQGGKLLFSETIIDETSTFEELNYESEYLKLKSRVFGVRPDEMVKKQYEVNVTTLSGFIAGKGLKNIDVLKIDTEGHEYKCLLGLFNNAGTDISFIQLEQHNDDMYRNKITKETINELLVKNNFRLFRTIKHGFGDLDEVIYKRS